MAVGYLKNVTDKQADDIQLANDNSDVDVNMNGVERKVGNPTGAGVDVVTARSGVVSAWNDKVQNIESKAGKRRVYDSNPVGFNDLD